MKFRCFCILFFHITFIEFVSSCFNASLFPLLFLPQSEVLNGVDAVKNAAKKALVAQEQSLEHNAATTSNLQGIKQVQSQTSFVFFISVLVTSLVQFCVVIEPVNSFERWGLLRLKFCKLIDFFSLLSFLTALGDGSRVS